MLKDHEEAGKWFFQAAAQGYAKSYYFLGAMFENGGGVCLTSAPLGQIEVIAYRRISGSS